MSKFFSEFGAKAGRAFRQGNWALQALTGTDEDLLRAETAVGRDLAAGVLAEMPLCPEPEKCAWVKDQGEALAARLTNKKRRFTFAVVEAGEPNAFALPGGFIFVERSLLELCQWDRDEVGFVLGHEIAHIVKGHSLQRILGTQGLARLAGAVPLGGPAGMLLKQVGLAFLTSAYSRENEFEADAFGARLAVAAGFAREGGGRLLGRLAQLTTGEEALPLFEYFASHPPLTERIAELRRAR